MMWCAREGDPGKLLRPLCLQMLGSRRLTTPARERIGGTFAGIMQMHQKKEGARGCPCCLPIKPFIRETSPCDTSCSSCHCVASSCALLVLWRHFEITHVVLICRPPGVTRQQKKRPSQPVKKRRRRMVPIKKQRARLLQEPPGTALPTPLVRSSRQLS